MLAEEFWSPIYLAAWFWIAAGFYRIIEEKRGVQSIGKLEHALMYGLAFASLGHGIIEGMRSTLVMQPLIANVLMSLTTVIPNYKKIGASVAFWSVLTLLVFFIGLSQLSQVDSSAFFNHRDMGIGYVISGSYAVLSVGVLLTLSHYSRLEFQHQFEVEEKTKALLDRLNKLIAHNLRSPLATLQMQLEIDRIKGLDVDRYESVLSVLIQTTEDMMSFNADLTQIESNELVKKVAHISSRVEIESLANKSFTMTNIRGVFFAVQNFIQNALKHTNGNVRFSVFGDSSDWMIKIADDGVGMSVNTLSQLGQKLQSKSGGMGIGLSLTKELADMNGFTIVYQSRLGLGTVVFIGKDCHTIEANLLKNWPTNVISCSHQEKVGMQPLPSSFIDQINTSNDN
jgi:signal transduction histidine kinase